MASKAVTATILVLLKQSVLRWRICGHAACANGASASTDACDSERPMIRSDVVFIFSVEIVGDAIRREFCRPPDQTSPGCSLPIPGERCRSRWCGDGRSSCVSRSRSLAEQRPGSCSTGSVSLNRPASVQSSGRIKGLFGRALAHECGERSSRAVSGLVTYHPFVAAFAEAPWTSKVVFVAQNDWAKWGGIRPWWPLYREAYRRIEERQADIFAVSEEFASRISPRVIEICQDFAQRRRGTAFVRNSTNIGAAANFTCVFGGFVGFFKLLLPSGPKRGLPLMLEA